MARGRTLGPLGLRPPMPTRGVGWSSRDHHAQGPTFGGHAARPLERQALTRETAGGGMASRRGRVGRAAVPPIGRRDVGEHDGSVSP